MEERRGILRSMACYYSPGNAAGSPEKSLVNDINIFSQHRKPLKVQSSVLTLAELSAKVVAECLPYSYVEERYENMPECVAKRIMFWSYPRHCCDIARYYVNPEEDNELPRGILAAESIVQVGFCVQGIVQDEGRNFHVSLTFDRCVITSVKCSCSEKRILWCHHANILATSIVFNRNRITPHMPLFPLISQLDRSQLQKLLQYLMSDHCFDVPDFVQSIHKEMLEAIQDTSEGKSVQDPTAFAGTESTPLWFLETKNVTKIKNDYEEWCASRLKCQSPDLPKLTKTTAEMVIVNDRNGLRILQIHSPMQIASDEQLKVWIFTVALPNVSNDLRHVYSRLLVNIPWSNEPYYTKRQYLLCDDKSFLASSDEQYPLLMPIRVGQMKWDIPLLRCILSGEDVFSMECKEMDAEGQLIWRERLPVSCERIEALLLNGYPLEAIRLAVSVARAIKDQARRWEKMWSKFQLRDHISWEMLENIVLSSDGYWMNTTQFERCIYLLDIFFVTLRYVSCIKLDKKTLSLLKNPQEGYFQLLVESLIVFSSERISKCDMYYAEESRKKWTTIISSAISGNEQYGGIPCGVLWKPIQLDAIRKLIETLTEAGPFTSCGNISWFGYFNYNYSLRMTKTIYSFDRDLAAKFACNLLACGSDAFEDSFGRSFGSRKGTNCYKFLYFIVSFFPEDVANQALDISLEQNYLERIGDVVRGVLRETRTEDTFFQQFGEVHITCTDVKGFVFSWLLRKLRSTLSIDRRLKGFEVLSVVCEFGSEQAVNILQHWEEYFNLSEAPEHDPYWSILENIQMELVKLALRLFNLDWEEGEKLVSLEQLFVSLGDLYHSQEVLSDQELELKQKLFKMGLVCAERKHKPSLEYESLWPTWETIAMLYPTEIDDRICVTPRYIDAFANRLSRVTIVNKKCRYLMYKLCLKNCKLSLGYTRISHSTYVFDLIMNAAKEASEIGEGEAAEVSSLIIENVQHTPSLFRVVERCYEFATEGGRKPMWLHILLKNALHKLEGETPHRLREIPERCRIESKECIRSELESISQLYLRSHLERISQLGRMLEFFSLP